jgi:hypothetical protein
VTQSFQAAVRPGRVGGLGGANGNEENHMDTQISRDGEWYKCRVDDDHPSAADIGFQHNHTTLRWEVYNMSRSGRNLDVDFTYLGSRCKELDATVGAMKSLDLPLLGKVRIGIEDYDLVGDIRGKVPNPCYKATGTGSGVH